MHVVCRDFQVNKVPHRISSHIMARILLLLVFPFDNNAATSVKVNKRRDNNEKTKI